MNRSRKAEGFTLVEIMIVVAVIGIIISIAVPAILRARESARGRACQENLSKIEQAMDQYALEFKLSNHSTIVYPDDLITPPGGTGVGVGYLRAAPKCPSGGTYSADNIGVVPACSIGSSTSPFEPHMIH